MTYVSILVTNYNSNDDVLARNLAMKVNDGDKIAANIVPDATILYKGGSALRHIDWTFGVPKEYALSQNYPNPFNPSTIINYDIPVEGHVSLKVYTYLGEEVTTLVDEDAHPGMYQVEWNARGLASGVYFYRLRTGHFVETRKLVLIK